MKHTLMAALLLVAASVQAADPGTASGSITVDGKATKLKYAYSRTKKNPFDKSKTDVVLLISDIEVPADVFTNEFKMMRFVSDSHLAGVEVEIEDDKSIISGTIYNPGLTDMNGSFSSTGRHVLETTTFNGTDIAGKLSAPEAEFFKHHYGYSATFHALPVAPPPPEKLKGTPLAADGGEPGKAYMDYTKVLRAGNLAELRKRLTADRAKQLDDPDIKKMLPVIQAMQPETIKITGGAVDGDTATLLVLGTSKDEKSTGKITMVKQGGRWKVEQESWETLSD